MAAQAIGNQFAQVSNQAAEIRLSRSAANEIDGSLQLTKLLGKLKYQGN